MLANKEADVGVWHQRVVHKDGQQVVVNVRHVLILEQRLPHIGIGFTNDEGTEQGNALIHIRAKHQQARRWGAHLDDGIVAQGAEIVSLNEDGARRKLDRVRDETCHVVRQNGSVQIGEQSGRKLVLTHG